jgi:hypothetical protein
MTTRSKPGLRRLRSHLAIIAFFSMVVSVSLPAAAIENGRPDGPRHRNVGLLGIDLDGPSGPLAPVAFCSGFVLSDSLFATAAHCIDVFGPDASWVVTLEPGSPDDPTYQPAEFDFIEFNIEDLSILVETEQMQSVCIHPSYNPVTFEHDLAVLGFEPGTFLVPPVQLSEQGWLDHLAEASLANMPLEIVGYGTEGRVGVNSALAPGYRKTALTSISGVEGNWLYYEPNSVWTGDTGLGDSGSPQFLTGRAVSLQTFPDRQAQRLDTAPELDFLHQILAGGCLG